VLTNEFDSDIRLHYFQFHTVLYRVHCMNIAVTRPT
jgi:hypothetical protein